MPTVAAFGCALSPLNGIFYMQQAVVVLSDQIATEAETARQVPNLPGEGVSIIRLDASCQFRALAAKSRCSYTFAAWTKDKVLGSQYNISSSRSHSHRQAETCIPSRLLDGGEYLAMLLSG